MTTLSKSSKEPSQITLTLPLSSQYDNRTRRHVLAPTSSEYEISGSASWKIAVAWVDSKARVTLYCRRNPSCDALLAAYSADIISTSTSYTVYCHQQYSNQEKIAVAWVDSKARVTLYCRICHTILRSALIFITKYSNQEKIAVAWVDSKARVTLYCRICHTILRSALIFITKYSNQEKIAVAWVDSKARVTLYCRICHTILRSALIFITKYSNQELVLHTPFIVTSRKIAVAWVDSKARVTLYCRRNPSCDALLAAYSADIISTSTSYTVYCHQQGHATFSGSTLETTAIIVLNVYSNLAQHIHNLGNTFLRVNITSMGAPADDMSMEIYENMYSNFDKDDLFSMSSSFAWDCVIVLQDKKQVHVQKSLLSLHSEYFKNAFPKATGLWEITVLSLDVDYGEFVDLLCVIYPTRHPITANNVETLSKLAHKFEMSHLLNHCDIFLTANCTKFGRSKLLLLAQNYNLEYLQKQCISEYKSIDDVKVIQSEPEYEYLNYRTKRLLLDKIIEIDSSALSETWLSETCRTSCNLRFNDLRTAEILDKLVSLSPCLPDIVLIVGYNKIPAHKQFLSYFSHFFFNMFQSEFMESRQNEIVLEEVHYEEVVELLSVTYPSDYTINEMNIATIVKLADRFIMPIILERCKKELKTSNKIKDALKLWLVQQYFSELQEEFAGKCNSIEDVQKLRSEPEFRLLDDKMRAMILESITK